MTDTALLKRLLHIHARCAYIKNVEARVSVRDATTDPRFDMLCNCFGIPDNSKKDYIKEALQSLTDDTQTAAPDPKSRFIDNVQRRTNVEDWADMPDVTSDEIQALDTLCAMELAIRERESNGKRKFLTDEHNMPKRSKCQRNQDKDDEAFRKMSLKALLSMAGATLEDVPGDGNCGVHVLSNIIRQMRLGNGQLKLKGHPHAGDVLDRISINDIYAPATAKDTRLLLVELLRNRIRHYIAQQCTCYPKALATELANETWGKEKRRESDPPGTWENMMKYLKKDGSWLRINDIQAVIQALKPDLIRTSIGVLFWSWNQDTRAWKPTLLVTGTRRHIHIVHHKRGLAHHFNLAVNANPGNRKLESFCEIEPDNAQCCLCYNQISPKHRAQVFNTTCGHTLCTICAIQLPNEEKFPFGARCPACNDSWFPQNQRGPTGADAFTADTIRQIVQEQQMQNGRAV